MNTAAHSTQQASPPHGIEAVVVGASAGGVEAMLSLFSPLPAGYPLPLVALLHLADDRVSRLAELFGRRVALPVREAADKEDIAAGTLYFATSGYHLSIEPDRSFSLSCEPPVHFSRPSIDLLMESAAEAYGPALLGILLTGANFDGAYGMQCIKQQGGYTVVQDPHEAQVAIMPQQALKQQQPDQVLTLAQISVLLNSLGNPHA